MWIGRSISLCVCCPGVAVVLGRNVPHGCRSSAAPGCRGRAGHRPSSETLCVTLTVAITGQCSWEQQAKPPTSTCVGQSCVVSLVNEITLSSCPRCKLMVLYSFFSPLPIQMVLKQGSFLVAPFVGFFYYYFSLTAGYVSLYFTGTWMPDDLTECYACGLL